MQCHHYPGEALLAEGHQHASADHRLHAIGQQTVAVWHAVGKRGVQGDGQCNVTESGHSGGAYLQLYRTSN